VCNFHLYGNIDIAAWKDSSTRIHAPAPHAFRVL
jgi:hypothetical protein